MTRQEKDRKRYAHYSFEDFLQDDYFIKSIKEPTDESIVFWNRFLKTCPEQIEQFHAAVNFIKETTHSRISEEEVNNYLEKLYAKIESSRRLKINRRIMYWVTAVAASIALLLVARYYFTTSSKQPVRNDIMSFVVNHADTLGHGTEIQLVLSDEKTVLLQDKESFISYDSVNIHTGAEQVSKKEVSSFNQLIVPYGKSTLLTLHDGTRIWVNAGSKLVYPTEFEKDKREIYVNGEIFLDVTPDAQRPFIIRTDELHIQVVGTRFNVQAYAIDDYSRIALETGLVKITSGETGDVLLSANKLYEQDKNGKTSVTDADVGLYTSWIYRLYMFESERLDVILKRLERYYGKEIVSGEAISKIRCSGKLDLMDNMEDVLYIISQTAQVTYLNDGEKYIFSHKP